MESREDQTEPDADRRKAKRRNAETPKGETGWGGRDRKLHFDDPAEVQIPEKSCKRDVGCCMKRHGVESLHRRQCRRCGSIQRSAISVQQSATRRAALVGRRCFGPFSWPPSISNCSPRHLGGRNVRKVSSGRELRELGNREDRTSSRGRGRWKGGFCAVDYALW